MLAASSPSPFFFLSSFPGPPAARPTTSARPFCVAKMLQNGATKPTSDVTGKNTSSRGSVTGRVHALHTTCSAVTIANMPMVSQFLSNGAPCGVPVAGSRPLLLPPWR